MSAVPPRTLEASVGARGSGSASSRLWIADTDFRLHDDIGFFIQRMLIRMEPTRPGAPLSLDDPTAMVARIQAGEIFVSDATLATLLNQDLAASRAVVRNLSMNTRKDGQEVRGELLRKGRWRPLRMLTEIELSGPLEVTLVPRRIFVDGVEVTSSLAAASIEMSEVLKLKTRHMELVGNRIRVDLDGLFPPPRLDFRVSRLALADGGMQLALGDSPGRPAMAGITGAGQLHVHRGRRYQDGAHRAGQGLRLVHQPQPGAAAAVQSLRLPAATAERRDPPARGRHGADRRVAGEGAGAAGGTAVSRRPWGVLLGWCLLAASAVQAESAIDRQQRELALLREGWYRQVPPAPVPLPMRTAGPADSGQDGVGILLRNVDMYLRGNIGFHVPEVKGWLVPNRAGQPVDFDRPQDMHFQVMEGEVLLSPRQLANLFNEHILAYDGTMLKDFRMSSAAGRLEVEGRVRPLGVGPWLPLRLGGGVEVDAASGALVYRPDQLRVIGLPLYGAMSLVGLPMSALVSLDRPGASLVGSAMRLDYRKVFPLLGIDGHVQEAWLDDQGLHLRFSQAPGQPSPVFSPPAAAGPSFLWLQSGDLKIFEILITYAQVLLKTETPDQVLTFNLQDYRKVLATGTTQVNEDGTFFMQVPPYANPL